VEVVDVFDFFYVTVSQKFDRASSLGSFSGALCRQIYDGGELRKQIIAQHHDLRLIPNDWRYFAPTLVFAGHYL
jgi:hypothetical protein